MASRFGPGWTRRSCSQLPGAVPVLRQTCAGAQRLTATRSRWPSRLKFRRLDEGPVRGLQQQVVRIVRGEVRHLGDIPLGDEEIGAAVIVHVLELGVPGGARPDVLAGMRAVGRHAEGKGDVVVGRRRWSVGRHGGEPLQLVVSHAGQEVFRIAVGIEVVGGDAHPPDPEESPALGLGDERGFRSGGNAPELFLAALVVFPVVRDAQRRRAGAVPVGEEHRERAEARGQRQGRGEAAGLGHGAVQPVVGAGAPGEGVLGAVDVVADGERRPAGAVLPGGGEGSGPAVAAVEAPGLVRALEAAVAEAAHHEVFAHPQQREVGEAVAIDIERIGAGDRLNLQHSGQRLEAQRAAGDGGVAVEPGGRGATGEEEVGETVRVAVEHRRAAADHVFPVALIGGGDAAGGFFLEDRHDRIGADGGRGEEGEGDEGAHAQDLVRSAVV